VTMTPAERSLWARIGAHSLHAKYESSALTQKARASFLATFEEQVDPLHELSEAERLRRAQHARQAHMARLALKSAQARRRRATDRTP
jgi:hypothetical protein